MATEQQRKREIAKASALVRAWRARYGATPNLRAVINVLSVAELETRAGDFAGSHNWGQIQRRQLTPSEQGQVAAGGTPQPRDEYEFLSTDTSPTSTGARIYHVWLWKFPSDERGADKLLSVLLDNRRTIRELIDSLSFEGLAGLMYDSKYFEGARPRDEPGGPAANKAAYAASLARQDVAALLGAWTPVDVPDESTPSVPPSPATPPPVPTPPPLVIVEEDATAIPAAASSSSSSPATSPAPAVVVPISPIAATKTQKVAAAGVIAFALAGVAAVVSTILHQCGGG